jgi:hypothetical protein
MRRFMSRSVWGVLAALAAVVLVAPPAAATNFGSTTCGTTTSGRPPNCISLANNRYHAVNFRYFGETASSREDIPGIRDATTYVLANVYSPTDLSAYRDEDDSQPDVIMSDFSYSGFPDIAGWVNCPSDNTGQGGSNPNRWCRGQTLTLNSYLYWVGEGVFDTAAQRRNVVCHELGHTLGLRHRTDTTDSCMWKYAGDGAAATLDGHDRAHVNGRY